MVRSGDQELHLEIDENTTEATDYRSLPMTRRTVLRRSVLGLSGIGLTAFLAACGDDEEEPAEEEPVEDEEVVEEEPVEEEPAEEEEEDGL